MSIRSSEIQGKNSFCQEERFLLHTGCQEKDKILQLFTPLLKYESLLHSYLGLIQ